MWETLQPWIEFFLKLVHILVVLALWIGPTLFFVRVGRNLRPIAEKHAIGGAWILHSGALSQYITYRKPPGTPPDIYVRYRYESLVALLSGLGLLIMMYWMNASMLVEQSDRDHMAGVLVGALVLVGGTIFYHAVWWKIPPGKHDLVGAVLCFGAIIFFSRLIFDVLTPRAAFLHIGAMFGTIMVSNVWLIIVPAQQKMLAGFQRNEELDARLSARNSRATKHNNFSTLPALALMISPHFPTVFDSGNKWVVTAGVVILGWAGGWLIRRYF